jgi:glycosyltransferase involved in cell wall biosynthesis
VLPGAAAVVVPSERLKTIALDLWRLRPEKVRLIPNGIRLDRFAPIDPQGTGSGPLVVGTVGSLRPVKNHARLLEAVAKVSDVHLLLVGDGEERPALERRAAEPDLAGRVRFAGYQESPAPFYQAMDVFALSSDSEQMPVALLEAMASALPVVSTDVGDVRTMLPPEQAPFLGPDLASGIARLAGDPVLRRQLGDLNRKRAEERYSFEALCAAYRNLYASVLTS